MRLIKYLQEDESNGSETFGGPAPGGSTFNSKGIFALVKRKKKPYKTEPDEIENDDEASKNEIM